MLKTVSVFFLFLFSSSLTLATPSTIFLIRHAEKPSSGPELSERGWERAKALPMLFSRQDFSNYGTPACLIGMNKKKVDGSVRALQTLKYVSDFFHVPVTDLFNKDQDKEMLHFVMTAPECNNRLVVISWEHNGLEGIATDLGVKPAAKWPGDVYDRVWVIDWKNGQVQMQSLPQRLLEGDSDQ